MAGSEPRHLHHTTPWLVAAGVSAGLLWASTPARAVCDPGNASYNLPDVVLIERSADGIAAELDVLEETTLLVIPGVHVILPITDDDTLVGRF